MDCPLKNFFCGFPKYLGILQEGLIGEEVEDGEDGVVLDAGPGDPDTLVGVSHALSSQDSRLKS